VTTLNSSIAKSILLENLWDDPYPIYRRLRAETPMAWVPAANRYMVTGYAEVAELEKHPEIFSANEHDSLMHREMDHTTLRKDGAAHRRERKSAESAVRPRMAKQHWTPIFQRMAHELIDGFVERGEADLFREFAAPLAALSLGAVLGLTAGATRCARLATCSSDPTTLAGSQRRERHARLHGYRTRGREQAWLPARCP
jgi:cytochrome P450